MKVISLKFNDSFEKDIIVYKNNLVTAKAQDKEFLLAIFVILFHYMEMIYRQYTLILDMVLQMPCSKTKIQSSLFYKRRMMVPSTNLELNIHGILKKVIS